MAMNERRGALPGIQRLAEMEKRASYEAEQARLKKLDAQIPIGVGESVIYGYLSYDNRSPKKGQSDAVSAYVDKINAEKTQQMDIWATWHRQDAGRLSKTPERRGKLIAKKIIADFSN